MAGAPAMLSAPQQSIAVLAYIKGKLAGDPATKKLLDDTFFLKNLDYNFVTLFAIYTGELLCLSLRL